MNKTWILVANARRARCFERRDAELSLTELADFVHPKTSLLGAAGGGDLSGEAGKGHGRTGHAGTQFEPRTEVQAKERHSFARQLADYINRGLAEHRYSSLVLIASSPMLGQLRPALSPSAEQALRRCVASDLTRYQNAELKERIAMALRLPD